MLLLSHRCERCRELASRALDAPLSEFERVLLARHLRGCADCRQFATDITAATELLRETVPVAAPRRILVEPARRARPLGRIFAASGMAAAVAASALVVSVGGLSSSSGTTQAAEQASGSADLASMRITRRQQLRPVADVSQLRIRVVEID